MKGLLNQEEQQPVGPEQQPPQETQNPEMQKEFDVFLANAMNIIYDKTVFDKMLKMIIGAENPVEAIAQATLNVIERLESSAAKNKVKISDGAKVQGANHVMGEIIGAAEKAGVQPLSEEQRAEAWQIAVSKYIDSALKSGKMTQEQVVQLSQEAQGSPEGQQIAQQIGQQGGQNVQ